ncbi:hypothetical protein J437_LFUL013303 [Ladona fulva]|uniref:Uncharacterized protein n=1 Tax=Ladona fulva TaxID=123851 RepID=A0A8K0P2B9_LADFU|nr:hypothetical protein J437_LFUL013303 [Ladona fulva]
MKFRNEVKSLKEALSREEKRRAEEVGRLAEDHRKTIDRLMETNVRMEEEFRNRMLEARKDWSRDMEAMRLAYQQSSNAAITNASLALLTGHGIGSSESKDKSEISKRDDSSTKLLSQCPEEVKGLSQTVERVETILMETLEAITPKVKKQNSKAAVNYAIDKRNQPKVGKSHKSVRDRRKAYYKVVSPRKRRRFVRNEKERTHSRHFASDEHLESDSSQQLGGTSSRDSVIGSHSSEVKKKNIRKFSNQFLCQYCKRCQHCRRKSSSPVNNGQRQKSEKEGKNVDEKTNIVLRDKLQKDYGNGEKVFRKSHESSWLNKIQERKNLLPASARMTLDDDYFSTVLPHRQPGVSRDMLVGR